MKLRPMSCGENAAVESLSDGVLQEMRISADRRSYAKSRKLCTESIKDSGCEYTGEQEFRVSKFELLVAKKNMPEFVIVLGGGLHLLNLSESFRS